MAAMWMAFFIEIGFANYMLWVGENRFAFFLVGAGTVISWI
jgi:hypothetical protein